MIELREVLLSDKTVNGEMERIFNEKLICAMELMLGLESEKNQKVRVLIELSSLNEEMKDIIPQAKEIAFPMKVLWIVNLYKRLNQKTYFEPTEVEKYMVHMLFVKISELEKDSLKAGYEMFPMPDKMLLEMIRNEGYEETDEVTSEDILEVWKDSSVYPDFFFEDEDYLFLDLLPTEIVCSLGCNEPF